MTLDDALRVPRRRRSSEERFWAKVDKTDSCWLWTAGLAHGYGQFRVGERPVGAHRYAYELLVGPIPDGLQLDHLCRVRHCVNPAHLEPVTQAENKRRGERRMRTHCPSGHPYNEENTYWFRGSRQCKECSRESVRRRRARARAAA